MKLKYTLKKLRAEGYDSILGPVGRKQKEADVLEMILLQLRNVLLKRVTFHID